MERINLQVFAEPELPANTITPEMNYETEAFINVGEPAEPSPTWASLAALTKNMAQSLNEVLYQATYYADKGWGSTEVTGAQMTLTLTGDVKLQKGKKIIIWPITIANITPAYGDSGAVNALTVTIHGNGRPAIGTTE